MRGRKPTPTAIKKAEGNPGKRKLSKVDLTTKPNRPAIPKWLGKTGGVRTIYKQIVDELYRLKIVRPIDQLAIACLADSVENLQTARRRMQKMKAELKAAGKDPDNAVLYSTPSGSIIQSPLVGIINREKLNILRYAVEFGMTASARARLLAGDDGAGLDEATKYEDYLSAERDDVDEADNTLPVM